MESYAMTPIKMMTLQCSVLSRPQKEKNIVYIPIEPAKDVK